MQGGSIGVSSIHNVGSTFTFYIKSRRAKDPNTLSITNGNKKNGSLSNRSKAQITQGDIKAPDGALPTAIPMKDQENGRVIDDHKYHILIVEDNLVNQRVLST